MFELHYCVDLNKLNDDDDIIFTLQKYSGADPGNGDASATGICTVCPVNLLPPFQYKLENDETMTKLW